MDAVTEIKTGVDEYWIADSRLALKLALKVLLDSRSEATSTAKECCELAATIADHMAEERAKRGGVQDKNDIRNTLALIEEHIPVAIAFIENLDKIAAKRRKAQKRHGDGGDDGE